MLASHYRSGILRRGAPRGKRAFTLIELLLSVAVAGLILIGMMQWIISVSLIWFNRDDNRYFKQHVEGVGTFMNSILERSEPAAEGGEDGMKVDWTLPPTYDEFDDHLLTFRLKEAPALLSAGEHAFPGITGYLVFEREDGLKILWHSRLQEVEDPDDMYLTLVSPWFDRVEFAYYDAEDEAWDVESEPRESDENSRNLLLPDFLILYFINEEDETYSETVYVPRNSPNAPLF